MSCQTHRTIVVAGAAAILTMSGWSVLADDVIETWVRRYNGAANMSDYGETVAVDAQGNAFISGFTFVEVQSNRFVPSFITIKYDISGNQQWLQTYTQGSWSYGATVSGIDPDGNLIVAGFANGSADWAIMKYASNGSRTWVRVRLLDSWFLTKPDDLFIDSVGNSYLTGYAGSDINPSYAPVLKYDSAGSLEWHSEYYGLEFDGASGSSVIADDAGNVYLAGTESVAGRSGDAFVAKFDASGTHLWTRTYGSRFAAAHDRFNRLAFDNNGNIVAAGVFGNNTSAGSDVAVRVHDPSGNLIWSALFDGGAGSDSAEDLAVDSSNNVVVAGYTRRTSNDYDALLVKFDDAGSLVWAREYGGTGFDTDWARRVEVDQTNNIYVAGTFRPFTGFDFFFTAKYDSSGALLWDQPYGGPQDGGCILRDMAMGPDGSVFAAGDSTGPGTEEDITLIRYDHPASGGPADLTNLTILEGNILAGSIDDLRASDDARLLTRSGFGDTLVDLHHMEFQVVAATTTTNAATVDLSIEASIDQPSGQAQVRLKNWNTNAFELVGTYAINQTESTQSILDLDASNYVSSTGSIELRIKHIVHVPFFAFNFDSYVDLVEIIVH